MRNSMFHLLIARCCSNSFGLRKVTISVNIRWIKGFVVGQWCARWSEIWSGALEPEPEPEPEPEYRRLRLALSLVCFYIKTFLLTIKKISRQVTRRDRKAQPKIAAVFGQLRELIQPFQLIKWLNECRLCDMNLNELKMSFLFILTLLSSLGQILMRKNERENRSIGTGSRHVIETVIGLFATSLFVLPKI